MSWHSHLASIKFQALLSVFVIRTSWTTSQRPTICRYTPPKYISNDMMLISTYQIKKRILNNWVAVVQSLSTSTNSQTSSTESSVIALSSQWDVAASSKNELTLVNMFYSRNKDIHRQSVLQNLEVTAMILLAMLNVSSPTIQWYISLFCANCYSHRATHWMDLYLTNITWASKLWSLYQCFIINKLYKTSKRAL